MNLPFNIFSRSKDAWEYRHEPEKMRLVAAIYWHTLLVLVMCSAIGAFFFGVQAMGEVTQAVNTVSAAAPQAPALDPAQLQSTLQAFSVRAIDYQLAASSSSSVITDPSQ